MSDDMLQTSIVHKNLDSKVKFFGMELIDVLIVAGTASILNLLFGQTNFGGPIVFGLPSLLALVIYFGKKGKCAMTVAGMDAVFSNIPVEIELILELKN